MSQKLSATNENLGQYAHAPAMRWLIATALDGSTITYGAIKSRLESEEGFSRIYSTKIGHVVGVLMERIQKVDADSPLINLLVVNQKDQLPSEGAGSFMAERFKKPKLKDPDFKQHSPEKWRRYFERAAAEVYAKSAEDWAQLYLRVFDEELPTAKIATERKMRQNGKEDDFGTGDRKYGAGGESEFHEELRLWVKENPQKIRKSFYGARTETEVYLDSGDRVDVVYHLKDQTIVLEVKSRISNEVDLRRGVFQCIKYRAVKAAMDVREEVPVEAILVTETDPPGEIKALLKKHGIGHRNVTFERK